MSDNFTAKKQIVVTMHAAWYDSRAAAAESYVSLHVTHDCLMCFMNIDVAAIGLNTALLHMIINKSPSTCMKLLHNVCLISLSIRRG